jgi:hypothetical protein
MCALPKTRKKMAHAMWISIIVLWLCFTSVALPVFVGTFLGVNRVAYLLAVTSVCVWVELAMLLGIYQAACAIFGTWWSEKTVVCVSRVRRDPVAILYTTMNDFQELAALSCVRQEYPSYHVFLLDDSTDEVNRQLVDRFHARFPDKTSVIRRSSKNGFKAGNLNHAIRIIQSWFPFFAVADADTVLPHHFVRSTVRRFSSNRIGFVQARLEVNEQLTSFVRELSPAQNLYWHRIVPACARFGFMMFHGHAALVRTAAWRDVGGFPEVVAEDLAFSTRAREMGYVGVLAFDVVCQEDHPQSYESFKVRQLKYTRGAMEHILTDTLRFIQAPGVPWFEKLDRLVGNFCLVSSTPFLFSVVCAGLAQSLHPVNQHAHADWRLFAVTALMMLLPLVPAFMELWRQPLILVLHVASSIFVHVSITVDVCADMLNFLLTGQNRFTPTGDLNAVRRDLGSGISILQTALIILLVGTNLQGINSTEIIIVLSSVAGILGSRKIEWAHPIALTFRYAPMCILLYVLVFNWPMGFLTASSVVLAANRSVFL